MSKQLLIESYAPQVFALVEGTGEKIIVRGEFGRVGVPTENNRLYPEEYVAREIKRLQEGVMSRRGLFGELDHPTDGKTLLKRASHVITKLEIIDGIIMGEAEILDTPNGLTLQSYFKKNCAVGISSRAFGSTTNVDGVDRVGSDLSLKAFDFVADPAMKTAYPTAFVEDVQGDIDEVGMLRSEFPTAVALLESEFKTQAEVRATAMIADLEREVESRVRASLEEQFAKHLADQLVTLREDVEQQVRTSIVEDTSNAPAAAILSQIAEMVGVYRMQPDELVVRDSMKAKDLEISTVCEERDQAVELAKQTSFQLHLEREVNGFELADTVRSLMEGSERSSSFEEYKSKLEAVKSELSVYVSNEDKVRADALDEELSSLREKVSLLESNNVELDNRLLRAVELGESLNVQLGDAVRRAERAETLAEKAKMSAYKAESVSGLTNSAELKSLLEGVDQRDAIDKVVSRVGSSTMADADLMHMRDSLKRGKTKKALNESQSEGSAQDEGFKLFGASMAEMKHLSGIVIPD